MIHKTIFVIGGGTGGHLFPAIALGEELSSRKYNVHLITDTRCAKYLPQNLTIKHHILTLGSLKSGILSKIFMSIKMIFAIARSISFLIVYRPSLVIGFGGYTSFPSLFAASLLNIPIMLHEQNCFLGKVNKFFAKKATIIALNFAETIGIPNNLEKKIIVSGNPVRKDFLLTTMSSNKKSQNEFNILIFGGSQGAKIFSSIIPEALKIISTKDPKIKLNIVQQSKEEDKLFLNEIYKDICNKFEIVEFFHDMPKRYYNSDLVISRSGASTIAELIYSEKPSILIPYPFAAENHQYYNAKVLYEKGACWYFEQKSIKPEELAYKIIEIAHDRNILKNASKKIAKLKIDSVRILANTVEKIMQSKV